MCIIERSRQEGWPRVYANFSVGGGARQVEAGIGKRAGHEFLPISGHEHELGKSKQV